MAILTTQIISNAGTAPSYAACAGGGDKVTPGPTTYIHVKNGSGGALTVTVDSVAPCSQGSDHNLVVSVPAAGERLIGPLPPDRYAAVTDGLVAVTYSGVTSLTIGAFAA